MIHRGKIVCFSHNNKKAFSQLSVESDDGTHIMQFSDYTSYEALDKLFPGFIADDYSLDISRILNQEIFFWIDENGINILERTNETEIQFRHYLEQNRHDLHL